MHRSPLTLAAVFAVLAIWPLATRAEGPRATREKLVGTWVGKVRVDADGLKKNPFVGADLPDKKVKGVALVFQLLASTRQQTLTFAKDGTAVNALSRWGQRQEKKGTWKLLEARGDRLTVQITHAKDKQVVRLRLRMLDNDHMELELPGIITEGFSHRFTRQKPPDK
jgi:hypothetical protein